MKNLIISPHTDDAIFSIGSFISEMEDVTILSVFSGIPYDTIGKYKHQLLREEHEMACRVIGAQYIYGDFLDDVYVNRNLSGLKDFLKMDSQGFDNIYIPLGIHHPDHILIRDIFMQESGINFTHIYSELPYRVLYPELSAALWINYCKEGNLISTKPNYAKARAVSEYRSQLQNEHILSELFVEERIWQK